ncbi:UvrD-helicase domain-containing protein [Acinetobacter tianfuensis]|uniref:RecBCD enzyme subunit RecB n=1 Tax=Acinetobacter tianfuensis TaxID=2419603 RepID=A0A3A8EKM4_9GAMM|nr:UvrD-helicase domain-containing protein [Acinetobacter tianfuensis]RKG31300.1 exodeoxyribonuclease V subunit beta [Acinetobacter tianfuensis]
MNIQEIEQPIRNMHFQGLHWIEASAGTGKTFTLSSLMVRILLEKYLPRQIIATTFTRKAAAELKSRIRQRLYNILALLETLRSEQVSEIQQRAAAEKDELVQVILERNAHQIGFACDRLQLVLDQLDELFVGTLDSFSQTLLREFAFESGKIERAEITNDDAVYIQQLVHDTLRAWLQQQPQAAVNLLLERKKIKSVAQYADLIASSLNFSSAKLLEAPLPEFNLDAVEQALAHVQTIDLDSIASLSNFTPEGSYSKLLLQPWSQHSIVHMVSQQLPALLLLAQEKGAASLLTGNHDELALLKKFIVKPDPRNAAGKKKIDEAEAAQIMQHLVMQAIQALLNALEQCAADLDGLEAYLKYYIAQQAKLQLPQMLQSKGETTFAQQIRTLSEALQGEQGEKFAAYVHARYPLILVDEFQDTNLDQDNMLAAIWRHPARLQQGCMIMVGDRKQAIYGFRGGDMLTFLKARNDVYRKQGCFYQLTRNFRSIAPLVDAVDTLFQRQMDFGEDVHYVPISAGASHPPLMDDGQMNPAPLRWVQLENSADEAQQAAWQICTLLNQSANGQLYFQQSESAQHRAVEDNDIAVLATSHAALTAVQQELLALGVRVNRAAKRSVFSSDIAQDVAAILSAVLTPYQESKVKRALLSRLMGLQLQDLWREDMQMLDLSHYIAQFDHIRELWLNQGFLPAWHYCLNYFKIWERIVALQSRDNERDVVNLRHLTELLSGQSEQLQGAQHLFHWYLKQLQSPQQREWELERALTNAEGVQLMTIHQSKGLEFKFVFLLNADGAPKVDNILIFSYEEKPLPDGQGTEKQRVVNISGHAEDAEKAQSDERRIAEQHRLWYVALTRASYRIYAMFRTQDHKSVYSLPFWRGKGEHQFVHPSSMDQPLIEAAPELQIASKQQQIPELAALPLPEARFYPRGNTSFTGLSQHLAHRSQVQDQLSAQADIHDSADDELDSESVVTMSAQGISWIKENFPKGTVAGTFLHSIYEQIDFQEPAGWHLEVLRRFKNDGPQLLTELREKFQAQFDVWKTFAQAWKNDYQQLTAHLHQTVQQVYGAGIATQEQHKQVRSMYLDLNSQILQQMLQAQDLSEQWTQIFADPARYDSAALLKCIKPLSDFIRQADTSAVHQIFVQQSQQHRISPALEMPRSPDFYQNIGFGVLVEGLVNDILYALMCQWIGQAVNTPMHNGFGLAQLSIAKRLPEFPFHLSLSDRPVQVQKIQRLFEQNGIQIEALNEANSARYLTGAIDLVYFDGQRYHIADYKSNFLGKAEQDYALPAIRQGMSSSSYWLQAAIYLLALHRYLQVRLQGYSIEQHLGGASYLYLRGMNGDGQYGLCHWQPEAEFIHQLDAIFGSFAADKLRNIA